MFFNRKFFVKIILFYSVFLSSSAFSQSRSLKEFLGAAGIKEVDDLPCIKAIKENYPDFLEGQLKGLKEEKFFGCITAFLDLFVHKKYAYHDSTRDHFTKNEIIYFFNREVGYNDEEKSKQITEKVLLIKKLFIGGSINNIKDKELSQLLNLIPDYRDAYFIIQEEIPIFKMLFKEGFRDIDSESKKQTLKQLRKTVLVLSRAYQRERVSYTVEDLAKYPSYMGKNSLRWNSVFSILQNVFEGVLVPQKEIKREGWTFFENVIRRGVDFLFYYNEHLLLKEDLTEIKFVYNSLAALERFFLVLSSNEKLFLERGFPLKNLDEILHASIDFINFSEDRASFLSRFKDKKRLNFFTRTLFALSLRSDKQKESSVEWINNPFRVSFTFPDSQFDFFKDYFTEKPLKEAYFISSKKFNKLKRWVKQYKQDLLEIHYELTEDLARKKGMEHWLDFFFGWNEKKEMIYGSFDWVDNDSKMIHFVNYQSFLSLFLASYMPEEFFYSEEVEISKKQWNEIVLNFTPFLLVFFGGNELQNNWRNSLEDLFLVADLFLNSSDANGSLNRKELMDLTVHLSTAFQQSQKVFPQLLGLCEGSDFSTCAVKSLLNQPGMLSSYPLFKDYIFPEKEQEYEKNFQSVLAGMERHSFSQLMELFFLIQVLEVNYYQKINTNVSFSLEYEELLVFAESLKEQMFLNIPYLYSSDQALAYLLYSFQFREIPFFTGSEFESVQFTHWYLNPEVQKPFSITPNHFHKVGFEFYNVYKKF